MTQKKINVCKPRWQSLEAKGFVRRVNGRIRTKKTKIHIEELAKSVIIPPDTNSDTPYGIPVDAKLAINLISDFHSLLTEPVLQRFIDGNDVNYNLATKSDQSIFIKTMNNLVDILRRSCAITIDKNVLLKTLSQPECEGLRFYLCKKNTDNKTDYLSLVTVGVNKNGKDHLYTYEPSKNKSPEKITSKLETMSLVSEYGHPPGSTNLKNKSLKEVYDNEPYVLLNYALDITEGNRKKSKILKNRKKKK